MITNYNVNPKGKVTYTCGCWEEDDTGIAEFCSYHDNIASAEEMQYDHEDRCPENLW